MEPKNKNAFAVWITGLPASGKSTLTAALKAQFAGRGIDAAVLESDVLRQVLTVHPNYDDAERDVFYRQISDLAGLLVEQGVPVIIDATANRRRYRDRAREEIPRFIEVFVDSPLETCMARDPKGIYRQARQRSTNRVPGLQSVYEKPQAPEVVVRGDQETPDAAAQRVIAKLIGNGYLPGSCSNYGGQDRAP